MTFDNPPRQHKGVTHLNAYCKVCGVISTTLIHSRNSLLTRIHIKCLKHTEHPSNTITFEKQVSKWHNPHETRWGDDH